MTNTIEVPFDIENVEIISTQTNEVGQFLITVKNTNESTCCHSCGKIATELYGHADARMVRHTSCFELETSIRFYPKRYECPHCGKTTTQQLSGIEPRCHHTMAYENHVLLQLVNSTFSSIAIKENLTVVFVSGIIDRHIKSGINWDLHDKLE